MAPRKELPSLGTLKERLDQVSTSQDLLPISKIRTAKNQPRKYFDEDKLLQLEKSIREQGIIEPLIVRPLKRNLYELVAGERRFRVAQRIGLQEVPAIVRELDDLDAAKISLIENLQREDLNPYEETAGIITLLSTEFNIPSEEVSPLLHRVQHQFKQSSNNVIGTPEFIKIESVFSSIGKMTWESFINNRLPILNLPGDIIDALRQGKLAYTKAKAISQVKDEAERGQLLRIAIEENLSLSAIKQYIQRSDSSTQHKSKEAALKKRMKVTISKLNKSDVWSSPSKQKKIEKFLNELEKLVS